jgi:hypothetical protein
MRSLLRPLVLAALLVPLVGASAPQRGPRIAALNGIETGQWQLKDAEGSVRRICVRDRTVLLQLMHGGAACDHVAMEDGPNGAAVRYSCTAHGHGRTTLVVETPRLLSIDTSGIADGAPFSEQYEARKIGTCG